MRSGGKGCGQGTEQGGGFGDPEGHREVSPAVFSRNEGPTLALPANAHKELLISFCVLCQLKKVNHLIASLEKTGIFERNVPWE